MPRLDAERIALWKSFQMAGEVVSRRIEAEMFDEFHLALPQFDMLAILANNKDQLRVKELLVRIEPEGIEEVILCTNPNTEGEVTAMRGDRRAGDDGAIVAGIARIDGRRIVVVGTQKGTDTESNIRRGFGMPHPEGYRKAMRAFELAERLHLPLLTLIDTPGAHPGPESEQHGIAEAIAAARAAGMAVYAVEQTDASVSLASMPTPAAGIVLVFGNEVSGVEPGTLSRCDGALEVPQFGLKHSLNVSVCGGAVLWEACRRYRGL